MPTKGIPEQRGRSWKHKKSADTFQCLRKPIPTHGYHENSLNRQRRRIARSRRIPENRRTGKQAKSSAEHPVSSCEARLSRRREAAPDRLRTSTQAAARPLRRNRRWSAAAAAPHRPGMPSGYFFPLGARIMFIFLPSSLGIISTLANSSRSVAKRSSRISPCSLKTIERPRKKT